MEQAIRCPKCGSTSIIEHHVMDDMVEKIVYRCLDCGKEFDEEEL